MTMMMRLTNDLRRRIREAATVFADGYRPTFECGIRATGDNADYTANENLWPEESDLYETKPLRELTAVDLDEDGECTLDLYVYSGRDIDRELEKNVYVTFNSDGQIVEASE